MAWIDPVVLEGKIVRLEPLEVRHAPGLLGAAEPELFRFTPQMPKEWSVAGFEEQIVQLNALPDVVAFAVVLQADESVIGRSTYMEIRPQHCTLEVGRTWIARAHQGTRVNPEMKFLMLRHAFERLSPPANRVQLTTSALNLHSQRAIAKLGAVREGTLRRDRILPDGVVRDTVYFSVIAEEWPGVKRGLEARMGWSG